jgi:hypothetical protein
LISEGREEATRDDEMDGAARLRAVTDPGSSDL